MGRRFVAALAATGLACAGLALVAPPAGATTFDVTSGADDGSPGTFRWAVLQAGANPGDDVVTVAASVPDITLDDCEAGRVEISPTGLLTINGNGTTITQTCEDEGVIGGVGDTTMKDLTLTGGDAIGDGGAIALNGGLTLVDVTVTGNFATGRGGGIFTVGATITDSTITDNASALDGGGIFLIGDGTLTVQSTTISDNIALGSGGGISAAELLDGDAQANAVGDATVDLLDVTLAGNAAATDGGGALINGFLTVTDSKVETNATTGAYGGVGAAVVSVVGSTVSGNLATETIGGVGGDTVAIVRSAVVDNGAPLAGGVGSTTSLSVDTSTVSSNVGGGLNSAGTVDLTFATIVGNEDANITSVGVITSWASVVAEAGTSDCVLNGGSTASQGYNFGGDTTCGFTGTGDTNGGGDPVLDDLAFNEGPTPNHLPLSGSPLLNKVPASDAACSGTDQRNFARPANGACDIGAVEIRQVSAVSSATTTPYQTPVVTDLKLLVTDPDFVLSQYEVQGVLHGDITGDDNGMVTYTPAAGFSGTDSYTYIVCSDSNVICTTTETISITVGPGPAAVPVVVTPVFTG